MKSVIRSTILAATLALGALPAMAATITSTSATLTSADVGVSWEVNYICSAATPCNGGTPYSTLAARTIYKLVDYVEVDGLAYWKFDLTIRNTSLLAAGGFLTAVGFATDPNAAIDSFWDANAVLADWQVSTELGHIPGFNDTEICVLSGTNCQNASDHSMTPGKQDRVMFWMSTALTTSLTFTDFAARWAGNAVTGGSFDAGGTIKVAPVPLPAAGGLLALGLLGLGALRRARKAA